MLTDLINIKDMLIYLIRCIRNDCLFNLLVKTCILILFVINKNIYLFNLIIYDTITYFLYLGLRFQFSYFGPFSIKKFHFLN